MRFLSFFDRIKLFSALIFLAGIPSWTQDILPIVYLGVDVPVMGKRYYGPMYFSDIKSKEVWVTSSINKNSSLFNVPIEFPKLPDSDIQYFGGNFWAKKGLQLFIWDQNNNKWQVGFNLPTPFMKFIPTTDGSILIAGSIETNLEGQRHLGPILQRFDGVSTEVLIPRPGFSPTEDWALWSTGVTDLTLFEMEDSVLIYSAFSGYLGVYDSESHRLRSVSAPWKSFDLKNIWAFLHDPKNRSTLKVEEQNHQPGEREVIVAPAPRKIQFIPTDHFSIIVVYADEEKMKVKENDKTTAQLSTSGGKRRSDIRVADSSKFLSAFELNLVSLEKTPITVDTDLPYPFWFKGGRLIPLGSMTNPSKEAETSSVNTLDGHKPSALPHPKS